MIIEEKRSAAAVTSSTALMTDGTPAERYLPVVAPKPSGPAAAALVAAGIGCLALGLLIIFSEAIPPFKSALALDAGVGPLSGKTVGAVLIYLVAWACLGLRWRSREIDMNRAMVATLVLSGLGFLGTFPIFFDLFTAH